MTDDQYDADLKILNSPLLRFIDGDEVAFQIIPVTPAQADFIMRRRNPHNRVLRPDAKASLCRDMENGHWHMNGETTKFDVDGNLLDGQHRYGALAVARVPSVDFLVVRGLEPQTQDTMDGGIKRTNADVLRLRGDTEPNVLASVVRKAWLWDQGDYRFGAAIKPTVSELLRYLEEKPQLYRSTEIAVRTRRHFPFLPQSVTGVAHYIFSEIDVETAVWFFQRLADGANIDVGHPVHTLRQRLISEREGTKRLYTDRYMMYLIRAWNAARRGEPLEKINSPRDNKMVMPI
jgi:hypothetical protein